MANINIYIIFHFLLLITAPILAMTKNKTGYIAAEETSVVEYLFTYYPGIALNRPPLEPFKDQYLKEECYNPEIKKESFRNRLEIFFSTLKDKENNPAYKPPFLLHEALFNSCNIEILKKLNKGGYDLNKIDPAGYTPLLLACKFKNEKAAEFLLSNVHEIKKSLTIPDRSFFNYLPIHYICQDTKNSKLLPRLLFAAQENGILATLLSTTNSLGNTPFETAVGSNPASLEMAKTLIAYGAPINKLSVMGRTPLMMSISTCEELVPFLLEKGANPNQTIQSEAKIKVADEGTPALHLACKYDKPHAVKALLEKGAQPNKVQESEHSQRNTALHIAATHGSELCIDELLKSKVINVNAVNNEGNTPVHEACTCKDPSFQIVQKLVSAGAKINVQNTMGLNALSLLITRNQCSKEVSRIASYLIANKASKQPQALHGVALATTIDKDMLSFLLQHGWGINEIDSRGNTILHKLINRKHQQELVFAGAPHLAKAYVNKINETINFIISIGAKPNFKNDGLKNPKTLDDILYQESSRDKVVPRLKKKSKDSLLALISKETDKFEFEEDDYADYPSDQVIVSQTRNGKKTYVRIDNFSPFMMQPHSGPIVLFEHQDEKRRKEDDMHHNFSLIVDHYLGAGIYIDTENLNDPSVSNLCNLLELKPVEQDSFAIVVLGKLLTQPYPDEKLVPTILQKKGTPGAFIYIFKKETKMCFHRKFNPIIGTKAQVSNCLNELKNKSREFAYNQKKTPALVLNT